ncbi:MAG TPA: ATP-binding protein, partial [Capillimicrobium sp.]|nr:ATP-binding protein [Capillimicrobium sp.]
RTEVERIHQALELAVGQIDESITGLRRLVTDLRPAALDDLGLPAALEGLVERVSETAGLKTTLRISLDGAGVGDDGDDDRAARLPEVVEDSAYRIVQEALTNVLRHAGPARARIRVVYGERDLIVEVDDDGAGAPAAEPSAAGAGAGLVGMRERAAALGGEVDAGPRDDAPGFRVRARLPAGSAA